MKRFPAWLTYTILRLLLLAVIFGVLLALGMNWVYAAFIATMVAFALSLVLLRKPREATAIAIYQARQNKRKNPVQAAEEAIEDAQADEVAARQSETAE